MQPTLVVNNVRAAGFRYQFVTLVPHEDAQKIPNDKLYPKVEYERKNSTKRVAEERSNDK